MSDRRETWRDTIRAVGEALIAVLRAEAEVIGETWRSSSREIGRVVGLVVILAYLSLICVPSLLILALLMGLHTGLGWPLWVAALVVAAVVSVLGLILARIALHLLTHRFESPIATVKHRFADHRAWWGEKILKSGADEGAEE